MIYPLNFPGIKGYDRTLHHQQSVEGYGGKFFPLEVTAGDTIKLLGHRSFIIGETRTFRSLSELGDWMDAAIGSPDIGLVSPPKES